MKFPLGHLFENTVAARKSIVLVAVQEERAFHASEAHFFLSLVAVLFEDGEEKNFQSNIC